METQRLDKLIASQSKISRSGARSLAKDGRILLNGSAVSDLSVRVTPGKDKIIIDSKPLDYKEHIYIMLNKPQGVVSASSDKKVKTVVDLVTPELQRDGLFPAGRLDRDTTGFVLITDDGSFAHKILSPGNHVSKTYFAALENPLDNEQVSALSVGITLADGTGCLPASVRAVSDDKKEAEIIICEGKYHQIKRMFAAVGNSVLSLRRTAIGGLPLDKALSFGECREITSDELKGLVENGKHIG